MTAIAYNILFLSLMSSTEGIEKNAENSADSVNKIRPAAALSGGGSSALPALSLPDLIAAPSPEVSAMLRHVDEEILYSEGNANLSVPLYSWDAGDIHLDIALRYRIGGYRVDERAGWTGLGWNLSAGGCVARTIIGMPDEKGTVDLRNMQSIATSSSAQTYFDDIEGHKAEASLDRYSYVYPGGSGSFVIKNGSIIQTPKNNDKIEFYGIINDGVRDFKITSVDGFRYYFTVREHIDFRHVHAVLSMPMRNDNYSGAVSSWHLARIESPGGESVTYTYNSLSSWNRSETYGDGTYSITNSDLESIKVFSSYDSGLCNNSGQFTTFSDQKILKSITSRTAVIDFMNSERSNYYDDDIPRMLNSIKVSTPGGEKVREITFDISSYRAAPSMLNSIKIEADGQIIDSHEFTYRRAGASPGKDFFGYPSSMASHNRPVIDYMTGKLNEEVAYDEDNANIRTMETHRNGLGLVTTYDFEPSSALCTRTRGRKSETYEFSVGVRIKRISDRDNITGRIRIREFAYSLAECDVDFNNLDASAFVVERGEKSFYPISELSYSTRYTSSMTFLSHSRLPGFAVENATIRYGEVTEMVSGTGLETPVRTVRKFDLSKCRLKFKSSQLPIISIVDKRSVGSIFYETNTPDGVKNLAGTGCYVYGAFESKLGASPLLTERIDYEYRNGTYQPLKTEKYFYSTVDSATLQTGIFYEPAVRDVLNVYNYRNRDWQSSSDFTYVDISVTHFDCRLDSISSTEHFPSGQQRHIGKRYFYTDPKMLRPLKAIKDPNITVDFVLVPALDPFGLDSISYKSAARIPVGEKIECGSQSLEHYVAYSSNIETPYFRSVCDNGQQTLPVKEIWVVNRKDTLSRDILYGKFGTAYRPVEIRLSSASGAVLDRQRVGGYSQYGKPTSVTALGKPELILTWGSSAEMADNITSMMQKGEGLSLTTAFTYKALTGCTSITLPDGAVTKYAYEGGRLVSVTAPDNVIVKKYSYSISGFNEDGVNYIKEYSRPDISSPFSETATYYDGYGLERLKLKKDFGNSDDSMTATSYDALHRPLREWRPLPVSNWEETLQNDNLLSNASLSLFSDDKGYMEYTYPASAISQAEIVMLPGTDFREHPARIDRECSRTADGKYRVVRYSDNGSILSSNGVYSDGELACTINTDGNGNETLTFTNWLGQVILSRQSAGNGTYADTYTVYDPWGHKSIVLPPEASKRLTAANSSWSHSSTVISEYAFIYQYDDAMRLRLKKDPGRSAERFAYDTEGRLLYSTDGNLSQSGRYNVIFRDALGREAITATASGRNVCDAIGTMQNQQPFVMKRSGDYGSDIYGTGYTPISTGTTLSMPGFEYRRITYYDDYGNVSDVIERIDGRDEEYDELEAICTTYTYKPGGYILSETISYPDLKVLVRTYDPNSVGMQRKLTETLSKDDKRLRTIERDYLYDSYGRVSSISLTDDGKASSKQTLQSTKYDVTGNVAEAKYGILVPRVNTYDIRGMLASWSMSSNYSQRLRYGDSSGTADWTGRITGKTSCIMQYEATYDYTYNPLGFLTKAGYSCQSSPELDFAASYTYDLQANLTSIRRNGLLVNGDCGLIEDSRINRVGNHIESVRSGDVEANPMENQSVIMQPDESYGYGYAYDANGNIDSDPGRGIIGIKYGDGGYPLRVMFRDGEEISYTYTSAGEKLREVYVDRDGTAIKTRNYYGEFEFTDGNLDRVQVEDGYVDKNGHYVMYVKDYQGNVLSLMNAKTGTTPQFTDYYPYGQPMGLSYAPNANRHKFGGKEYTTEFGFASSDFGARLYSPLYGSFGSVDRKAGDFDHLSPYSYCAGDPINFIDPTGEEVTLYATELPGLSHTLRKFLKLATHTFLVVTKSDGKREIIAYGSEYEGPVGAFQRRLQRCYYIQDEAIADGFEKDKLKKAIPIPPPEGMTQDEFDQKVIDVANSFGNNPEIGYLVAPLTRTKGNCNSSTSTILLKSGVSKSFIRYLQDEIPDLHWGFETSPKPWTEKEQRDAVKIRELKKLFDISDLL